MKKFITLLVMLIPLISLSQTPQVWTDKLRLNPNAISLTNNGEFNYLLSTHKIKVRINGVSENIATESWVTANAPGPSIGGTLTGATSGSVLFAGSGTFAQDNTHLFYDDTNDLLVVGSNSPASSTRLTVNGIASQTIADFRDNSSASKFAILNNGSTVLTTSTTTSSRNVQTLTGTFNPASGAQSIIWSRIIGTYNTTGTYVGQCVGYDFDPTVTSATGLTSLAFRSTSGLSLFGGVSPNSTDTRVQINGITNGSMLRMMGSAGATRFLFTDGGTVTHDVANGSTTTTGYGITGAFTRSSGTNSMTWLSITGTHNTTSTYSGTIRGVYYNPTNTSLTGATHIAFENTSGQIRLGGVTQDDTKTRIAALDASTNQVYWRDVTTIGGSGFTGSGSASRLTYWTSTSALSFGPHWDNTNTRLGIGAAPTYPLDISVSSGNAVARILNTSTGDSNLTFQRSSGTTTDWSMYAPSGSTELRLNSSGDKFYFNTSGQLGVGGSIASNRSLTLNSTGIDNVVRINSPTGFDPYIEFMENNSSSAGQFWQVYKANSDDRLAFYNGSERLSLSSGGNLTVSGGIVTSTIGSSSGDHTVTSADDIILSAADEIQTTNIIKIAVGGYTNSLGAGAISMSGTGVSSTLSAVDLTFNVAAGATISNSGGSVNITDGHVTDLQVQGGVTNNGSGLKHKRITTGSIGGGITTTVTVSWTSAFVDTNYTPFAIIEDGSATDGLEIVRITAKATGSITVEIRNNDASNSITGTISAMAMHD